VNRIPAIVVVLLLAWLGLGVPAESIALWLDPAIDPERLAVVRDGVSLLQLLLLVDAVLVMLLVLGACQYLQGISRDATGLWQPAQRSAQDASWQSLYFPALLIILLLATLLRGWSLNTDLWIDEIFTLVNFVRLPLGELVTDFTDDNQHLFFSVLSHLSVALFGESHWAVRLPAVIFGVGSIWAVMRLACLVYGNRAAVMTGLLLALSWHHIWFSQNARGYTILLFGTVLATELLLRALRDGLWRYWVGYALVIAFSAWAHVTAVFVALAHGLVVVLLLLKRGQLRRAAWAPLGGFLLAAWFTLHLYALVLPQMLEFFSQPGAGTGVAPLEWRNPLWLFNEIFQRIGIPTAFGWAGMAGVLLVLLLCAWWYLRREPLFVFLAVLPGLMLGFTMFLLGRNLWPRMFFNEIGFVVLLIVVGLLASGDVLARKIRAIPAPVAALVPVAGLALLFAVTLPGLYRYPKQDFTGARDYVLAHMDESDNVIGLHVTGRVYNQYYARQWQEANSLEELEQRRSATGHTWVLYTLPNYINTVMPDLARVIDQQYELVKVFPGTLGDGAIIVRRSRSHSNQ
jgi:hypothetical protein